MKKIFYAAFLAVFVAGCGSNSANVEPNAVKVNVNSNAQIVSVNAATTQQMNALPPPPSVSQSNVNAANVPDANHTLQEVSSVSLKNVERLKSKGGGDQNAAPIPSVKATPNAAPDNSELSSTMTAKGVPIETRVFKNNPTLQKIERTFEDIANPVTKVYLKNGKVLTIPQGAVEKPESATADEILRAVGVKP